MRRFLRCSSLLCGTLFAGLMPAAAQMTLRTASTHPMQYYVSRPQGWTASKTWPVVVVIEAADREFKANADKFVAERGARPYIIVAPVVLTGGGTAQQHKENYTYSDAVWRPLGAGGEGNCAFDQAGLDAVLADVRRLDSGESKVFLTGWEAAGHFVWAELFRRPERLRAVALVTPNFAGRCIDDAHISTDPARTTLPVVVFHGGADNYWGPGLFGLVQWQRAHDLAAAHGFGRVTETAVAPYTHGPLPKDVLAFFDRALKP